MGDKYTLPAIWNSVISVSHFMVWLFRMEISGDDILRSGTDFPHVGAVFLSFHAHGAEALFLHDPANYLLGYCYPGALYVSMDTPVSIATVYI